MMNPHTPTETDYETKDPAEKEHVKKNESDEKTT